MKYLRKLNSIGDQNPENYVEPSLALVGNQIYTNMEEYPWIVAEYKVNSLPANIYNSIGVDVDKIYDNGKLYDGTEFNTPGNYMVFIILKNIVTFIRHAAFRDCSTLTSLVIPSGVTSIGENAFRECSGLTSIEIPNSVISIGQNAFGGTAWYDNQPDGLVYAGKVAYKYKGTMPEDTNITLKEGTLGIANCAFLYCSGLKSIVIPSSVTEIGSSAFYFCRGLTSVVIPSSVTSIENYTFSYCRGLTSVVIPSSVRSIGESAFEDCSGLTSVTCLATTPPTLGNNAFYNTKSCPIYVPSGSVDAYKSAWSSYASRIQSI